jgi:hypothetical protein
MTRAMTTDSGSFDEVRIKKYEWSDREERHRR